jgi:hypothetical protein
MIIQNTKTLVDGVLRYLSIRTSIIIAIVLAVVIPLVTWFFYRDKPKSTINAIVPVIAYGLDDIGVKLTPAYPDRSWREMILSNGSDYHIVAAVIIYEFTREEDGQKLAVSQVFGHPEVALEKDPIKIKTLINKYPLFIFPPHSKWIVGLGIDNMQIKENLPTLEEVLESSAMLLELTDIDKKPLKQIAIILDGVMLEDGQLVGPQKLNIRQLLEEKLQQRPGGSK